MVLTTGCQDPSSRSLCSATSEKPNSAGKRAKTIMLLNCQTTFPPLCRLRSLRLSVQFHPPEVLIVGATEAT